MTEYRPAQLVPRLVKVTQPGDVFVGAGSLDLDAGQVGLGPDELRAGQPVQPQAVKPAP